MGCIKMLLGAFLLMCSTALVTSVTSGGPVSIFSNDSNEIESILASGEEGNKTAASEILSDNFYQTASDKFYVSKVRQTWQDAAKDCEAVGMKLASMTSQQEQLELYKFLFVNYLVPEDDFSGYWLSGQQIDTGLYKWMAVNYHINCWGWLPGEPSHIDDLEHCVELKYESEFVRLGWNNYKCEEKRQFICQDETHDSHKGSHDDWETSCYWFYNRRFTRLG